MQLIFLGPPGAGKGTIAQRLVDQRGLVQISTGDLLREAVKADSVLGREAKGYMDAGELVPDVLVINLLKARIRENDCMDGFILDGFPRTLPQADALNATDITIDKVINLNVPDTLVIDRLSGRRIHKQSGKIYNVNPGGQPQPPREMPASALFQRDDDKPEAISNRLLVYQRQTEPLVNYYREKGLLADINAAQDLDSILHDVMRILPAEKEI